jgi:ferredoxin
VKLPHVNRERCIGCGICEYKCPLNGESAIRVYAPTTDPLG